MNHEKDQNSILSINQITSYNAESNEKDSVLKLGYKDYFKFLKNTNLSNANPLQRKFPTINNFHDINYKNANENALHPVFSKMNHLSNNTDMLFCYERKKSLLNQPNNFDFHKNSFLFNNGITSKLIFYIIKYLIYLIKILNFKKGNFSAEKDLFHINPHYLDNNYQMYMNNLAPNFSRSSDNLIKSTCLPSISKTEEQILLAAQIGRERIQNLTSLNLLNYNPININNKKQEKNKKTSKTKANEMKDKKEKSMTNVSKYKKEELVNLTLESLKNFDFFNPVDNQQTSRNLKALDSVERNDYQSFNKR